jgi:Rha family phage regulatory protein
MNMDLPTRVAPEVRLSHGQPLTTSLNIAQVFSKQHKDVLRAIERLDCSEEFRKRNFALTSALIPQPKGGTRESPAYEITRDGFMFLAMGFTGKEAARWKEAYIQAFNRMAEQLAEGFRKIAAQPVQAAPEIRESNGLLVTSTLNIAQVFGKQHNYVLYAISLLKYSEEFMRRNFIPGTYLAPHQHREHPLYHVTRNGFMGLAMRWTRPDTERLVEAYLAAFDRAAEQLPEAPPETHPPATDSPTPDSNLLLSLQAEIIELQRFKIGVLAQSSHQPAPVTRDSSPAELLPSTAGHADDVVESGVAVEAGRQS